MATITQRYVERDGHRILWRIAIDDLVALDVLTDAGTLEGAYKTIEQAPARGLTEHRLGSFVFQGGQSAVFHVDRASLLKALLLT
jgi:hypothetical protein